MSGLQNDLLLKALQGTPVPRPPVWMMRQAGRFLPDYIKLRDKYSFFERCQTPELATEITVMPVDQVGVDAAIIFSDILVVPQAMGMEVQLVEKMGPLLPQPVKSAADLARFKEVFADPEDPGRGRIYGCPAGWACGTLNDNLLRALGLERDYSLFAPGSGAAQKAAILSAYKRKQNVVFYYWSPTPLVGAMDLVKLEMPPYDAEKHKCLTSPKCAKPEPSAYPDNPVFTAVNTKFSQEAPVLTEFLSKVSVPLPVMNETLAHMEETGDESGAVAKWFLKNKPESGPSGSPPTSPGACKARCNPRAFPAVVRSGWPGRTIGLDFFPLG